MKSIKREIISRETIKPSSPTPPHLRSYQLSTLDQFAPRIHVPFALFYEAPFHRHHPSSDDIDGSPELLRDGLVPLLKQSLSQVLTHYYPLAGRLRDRIAIDCNDAGVEFVECRVNCEVPEVLNDSYTGKLDLFFAADVLETSPGLLLVIQVSLLERGGVAIGVSCSHAVADASSLSTFVNDWALKARLSSVPTAEFVGSSILPPGDPLNVPEVDFEAREKGHVVVTKRILFDASRIALLKEMARGSGVENPTRVELVMALILKRAAASAAASKAVAGQHLKELVAIQAVDLRRRLVPPLSSRSFGNAVGALAFKTRTDEEGMDYGKLVRKLRDEKENFFKQVAESSSSFLVQNMQEVGKVLLDVASEETNVYIFTSWCGFGFYDADFGWGKPIWLAESANDRYSNAISLTDTGDKGGGMEVHISLEAREMALFERNLETLVAPS